MKFEDLFPAMESDHDIQYGGSGILKADSISPCWHCKEPTQFIDIQFETALCSTECFDAKWLEYDLAHTHPARLDRSG